MRKKIVAGNWKMNKTLPEAILLASDIEQLLPTLKSDNVRIVLAPSFPFIGVLKNTFKNSASVFIGAQNCSSEDLGAFTGEVSASMLASMELTYVIIGHSERRKFQNETNELLSKKIQLALKYQLTPIYCVGETLAEREAAKHFNAVKEQLEKAIWILSAEQASKMVIAYEPVWAIGTGKTATAMQAQEMHAFVRMTLSEKFGKDASQTISILYGGSCNSKNAAELFACPDIDGGLIGGASLDAKEFIAIANSL